MIAVPDRLESPATYDRARSDIYVLLAALLTQPPSAEVLKGIRRLDVEEGLPGRLHTALVTLRKAGRSYSLTELELEFRELFIGLGSGEIVPFASWYRERRLMAGPLAELRGDLRCLGLCRREGALEPEDHAGVLCEILAMISREDSGVSLGRQRSFFTAHVLPWSILPDAVEWDEWKTGERHEGTFYSLVTLAQKVASSIAIPLALLLLGFFGYRSSADSQPDSALFAIRLITGPIPVVLLGLGILCAALYPINRKMHAAILADLAARRGAKPGLS